MLKLKGHQDSSPKSMYLQLNHLISVRKSKSECDGENSEVEFRYSVVLDYAYMHDHVRA